MRSNRLGSSDLLVSEIGLGCMSLGTDPRRAADIVHRAVELGVTFFDTADLYNRGVNEELVGRALRGVRDRVVIASKVGNRWRGDGSGWDWDPSKAYIRQAVEGSLRRLGVEVIDLYQLHGGTIDDPVDETIEAFEELKAEGLIRCYGLSSIRPNVIREYVRRSNIASVMMQHSLLDRRPEEEIFGLLLDHGVSVIVRGPVAKGLLADKPPAPYLEHGPEVVAAAQEALDRAVGPRRSRAQVALRYSLAHPVVATLIPGASSLFQLEENLAAAESPALTEGELSRLREVVPALHYRQHR
ncbi:MAG: aldo/keto reductase [Truepera sp.]|nr:aldo/keto reductase [Truepera sp.]